ncbi:MAG TPA: PHB depolymerase family esterase [Nevskiaceae bacterium]|nr:PHB depolymerase family esterase [Nevskiaceae bacterium]
MRVRDAIVGFSLALCACANSNTPSPVGDGESSDANSDPEKLGPGSFTKHTFTGDSLPHRDYYVYVPSTLPSGAVPLVVYLHGCQQTAMDAALGTLWNQTAESDGFIVVYPEQQVNAEGTDGNAGHCWNWYLPENISRDTGEAGTIAGITRDVIAANPIDPDRVFIMGISAGGAMTAVMGATYPDLYAALGIDAGVAYQGDASGESAATAMGQYARVMPVIVIQGTADEVVLFGAGYSAVQQWLGTDDLVDDGAANDSVSSRPASIENFGVDASMLANIGTIGDLCITPPLDVPCLGAALGLDQYPYTIAHYVDASGAPLIDFWIIHGLGHTYPGGSRNGNFTDPIGPSATIATWEFFKAHPRSSSP